MTPRGQMSRGANSQPGTRSWLLVPIDVSLILLSLLLLATLLLVVGGVAFVPCGLRVLHLLFLTYSFGLFSLSCFCRSRHDDAAARSSDLRPESTAEISTTDQKSEQQEDHRRLFLSRQT